MDSQEKRDPEVQPKKQEAKEELDFCTTAPSAEHSRAGNDDEPCDDSRSSE